MKIYQHDEFLELCRANGGNPPDPPVLRQLLTTKTLDIETHFLMLWVRTKKKHAAAVEENFRQLRVYESQRRQEGQFRPKHRFRRAWHIATTAMFFSAYVTWGLTGWLTWCCIPLLEFLLALDHGVILGALFAMGLTCVSHLMFLPAVILFGMSDELRKYTIKSPPPSETDCLYLEWIRNHTEEPYELNFLHLKVIEEFRKGEYEETCDLPFNTYWSNASLNEISRRKLECLCIHRLRKLLFPDVEKWKELHEDHENSLQQECGDVDDGGGPAAWKYQHSDWPMKELWSTRMLCFLICHCVDVFLFYSFPTVVFVDFLNLMIVLAHTAMDPGSTAVLKLEAWLFLFNLLVSAFLMCLQSGGGREYIFKRWFLAEERGKLEGEGEDIDGTDNDNATAASSISDFRH